MVNICRKHGINPSTAMLHVWNGSDLSRFQSLTEPSAAQEARLMSFLSRDTVALGWNTIAPTLVLCPEGKGKPKFTISQFFRKAAFPSYW